MRQNLFGIKNKLACLCLIGMTASLFPAAHAFWGAVTDPNAMPAAAIGSAPSAEPVEAETYKGVMIEIPLRATDPDGDAVIFKLADTPRIGVAVIQENKLQYTPQDGKTGVDKFSYVAIDTLGNTSEPAQIKIKVQKNKAKMTYADMETNPAHFAALRLAQAGVLTGEKIGASYFFHPEETVTRSQFIAMTAAAAQLDLVPTVQTDFVDDSGLSDWVKPYISAAASEGLVSGYMTASGACEIRGANPITLAEASVVLSNLLGSDPNATMQTIADAPDGEPVWAQNAAAVLTSAEILPDTLRDAAADTPLTRENACTLLYGAMQRLS